MPRRSGADELLLKVFTAAPQRAHGAQGGQRAARDAQSRCASKSCVPGAFSEYLVHQVLRLMIERCEALDLYVRGPRRELKAHLKWVIARLAESYEERQLPRVAL